jgi:hypothetical protein
MNKVQYDTKKFVSDSYGNLYPKQSNKKGLKNENKTTKNKK